MKPRPVAHQFITCLAILFFSATVWADLTPQTLLRQVTYAPESADYPSFPYTVVFSDAELVGGKVPFTITITSTARDYALTAVYWNNHVFPGVWQAVSQEAGDLQEPPRALNLAQGMNIQERRLTLPDHSAGSTTGAGSQKLYAALSAADAQTPAPFRRLGNSELIDLTPDLARNGPGDGATAQMNALVIRVGAELQALDPHRYPTAEVGSLYRQPTVPTPSAFLLGAIGLGLVGWVKRKFL